jgi:hypothetical protein
MKIRSPLLIGAGLFYLLAACAPLDDTGQVTRLSLSELSFPPAKLPPGKAAPASTRSNASIARDFMLLAFQLESGRRLPVLSRFEWPITLRVTGESISATNRRDLSQLISRLQNEARINLSQTDRDAPANITVQFLKQSTLRRAVPHAACFVAPGISSWREFTSRRGDTTNWTELTTRTQMAIFLPADVSAQEIRDCLHEEIAQALGPVNDLYHLTDSIFNDDNFHTVLTGFDMLILRTFYDRELRSGMTPNAVHARLSAILSRLHPRGRAGANPQPSLTTRNWTTEIETALGGRNAGSSQLAAARRAVQIAQDNGWNDNRLGFAFYAQGRLALAQNSPLALNSFARADAIFRADPTTRLHSAHVAVQAAAFALSAGRPETAIQIVNDSSPVALRAENANLLATLLMIKAAALDAEGKSEQADIVRLDALGWARYGLNSKTEIRQRLNEIATLAPPSKGNPDT